MFFNATILILTLAICLLVTYIVILLHTKNSGGLQQQYQELQMQMQLQVQQQQQQQLHQQQQPTKTTIIIADSKNYTPPIVYGQLGYLTPVQDPTNGKKLPFYGDASPSRRGRYYYYTIVDDIKIPLTYNKRDCMEELACDAVYDGDEVLVGSLSYLVKLYGKR